MTFPWFEPMTPHTPSKSKVDYSLFSIFSQSSELGQCRQLDRESDSREEEVEFGVEQEVHVGEVARIIPSTIKKLNSK